jgi:hypothetical protein
VEELISMCLCNTENENCMYGVCTSCPSAETLGVLLQNELDDSRVQTVGSDRQNNSHDCNTAI